MVAAAATAVGALEVPVVVVAGVEAGNSAEVLTAPAIVEASRVVE